MIDAFKALLSLSSVVWLCLTIMVYIAAKRFQRKANDSPLLHPVLITTIILLISLSLCEIPVGAYQVSVSVLHWLLGPATVALAIPIYNQWEKVRAYGPLLWVSIVFSGLISPLLAWLALWVTDTNRVLQLTVLVKSITTPFAIGTAEQIGGLPELAAAFVIITGIVGAITAPLAFALFNVSMRSAKGLALGSVSHAIGVSKAIHMGEDIAAMAILGLCLNGVVTAIILPMIFT